MSAVEISPGMRVRYPRTGTTGTVLRIEQVRGEDFAELDSTHLLYRIDQLIPATITEKTSSAKPREDVITAIERERQYAAGAGFQEAIKDIDHSCEGGG